MLANDTVPVPLAGDTPVSLSPCVVLAVVMFVPLWETRLWASRAGRGHWAASLEFFLNGAKAFSGPVWPFTDEKPRPG